MPRAKTAERAAAKKVLIERVGCYKCGLGAAKPSESVPYNPRQYVLDGDPLSREPVAVICRRCLARERRAPNGTLQAHPSAFPAPKTPVDHSPIDYSPVDPIGWVATQENLKSFGKKTGKKDGRKDIKA